MDLEAIGEYSIERFGIEQARHDRDQLSACLQQLADDPGLGRRAEQLSAGLHRYEHRSHIIFYQAVDTETLIVRVLHYRMDVRRHL